MRNQAKNKIITASIAAGYSLILAGLLALAACAQNEAAKPAVPEFTARAPETGKEYISAIHLQHNPARQSDFALPYPYQTQNPLKHGYHVIAKMGGGNKFTGIILVRRDSGISKVTDLKGKKVSCTGYLREHRHGTI